MVQPHGRSLNLSGYADPDAALTLEVDAGRYSFRSDAAGRWQTEIESLPDHAAVSSFELDLIRD